MRGNFARVGLCVLALVGVAVPLRAQDTTATISGTVRDQTGAVMPGVTITTKNVGTNAERNEPTDLAGRYRIRSLPVGNYEVRAELSGFQTSVRRGIELTVGREAVVDFALQAGDVSETVVVTGEAPLVDTTSGAQVGLVTREKIDQLPLNGRDLTQLMTLEGGVTLIRAGAQDASAGYGMKMSISGARPDMVGWLLDGTDVQTTLKTGPAGAAGVQLGVEAVQEFRVMTSSYSAEYGTVGGGTVNSVTKSGTNDVHGSAFEFIRDSGLDARNYFDDEKAPFRRNQFGGSLGGPVRKNRMFFFATYEGLRQTLGTTSEAVVPNADARRGLLPGAAPIAVNPATVPVLAMFPLPNAGDLGKGVGIYRRVQENPTNEHYFTGRIDHAFTDNLHLFGRFTYDHGKVQSQDNLGVLSARSETKRRWVTIEQTHVLSAHWLNKTRFGYSRSLDGDSVEPLVDAAPLMLTPFPYTANMAVSGLEGLGMAVTLPREYDLTQMELADDLSFATGNHSLKVGIQYKRYALFSNQQSRGGGQWRFNSLADFLAGRVASFDAPMPGADVVRHQRQDLFGMYAQDSYQAGKNMTINAGLRYEFVTIPVERDGKSAAVRNVMDNAATPGPLFANPSLKNVAPRVGIAWDPFGTGKSSIRGGVGIFYDQFLPNYWRSQAVRQPPYFSRGTLSNAPMANTYNTMVSSGKVPALDLTSMDFYPQTPTMVQFNGSMQRQISDTMVVEAGYSGSRGFHLVRAKEGDSAIPVILADGTKFFPVGAPKRNPVWGSDRRSVTDALSWYNALLLSVRQRLSNGLQFQSSYTLAKSVDEASSTFKAALDGMFLSIDPEDHTRNRGLSNFNIRHNLVTNVLWQVPWGSADGASGAAKALGGWQVGAIVTLQSGLPSTPVLGFNNSRNQSSRNLFEVPNLKPGASDNPVLGGYVKYFDPTVFELAPAGTYGNLKRNTLIGPGVALLDANFTKSIPAGRFKAQIRIELFNVLNRVNLGPPLVEPVLLADGAVNPAAGRISTTSTPARQAQFGLKLVW